MPGLPTRPCFYDIDIDPDTEEIYGLMWRNVINRWILHEMYRSQDSPTVKRLVHPIICWKKDIVLSWQHIIEYRDVFVCNWIALLIPALDFLKNLASFVFALNITKAHDLILK